MPNLLINFSFARRSSGQIYCAEHDQIVSNIQKGYNTSFSCHHSQNQFTSLKGQLVRHRPWVKKWRIKTRGGGNGVFSVRVISEEGEGRCVSFVKEKTETLDADRSLVAPTNLRQCLRHTEKSRPE